MKKAIVKLFKILKLALIDFGKWTFFNIQFILFGLQPFWLLFVLIKVLKFCENAYGYVDNKLVIVIVALVYLALVILYKLLGYLIDELKPTPPKPPKRFVKENADMLYLETTNENLSALTEYLYKLQKYYDNEGGIKK